MANSLGDKLVVAISSTALFDLEESHQIFMNDGVRSYSEYQIDHEEELLKPGAAFGLVKKLLALNDLGRDTPKVEVILLSRNSADTGLRIFNSIEAHNLDITRAAFTSGRTPYKYVSAFGTHLFLSTNKEDVRRALENGYAAATIMSGGRPDGGNEHQQELRFAFDGDAVLFSDESEKIYKKQGLKAFSDNERAAAREPMKGGPFKNFLSALHGIQKDFTESECPIRTALVTARSAPAHERVVRTLRSWNIRIDEALFLGGLSKGEFLKAYGADVFFDDQHDHVNSASEHIVTAGHVPHGIANAE
ncbi:5'-nucleotidase [Pleionea sp. CnH1-48]|uniref:5'-nucleotidase n=1 Tax=Pleionea sp. CnH1-48 TaxID=2954494 RepID=UPI002097D6AC|nr:5'-nucleotidase [Pleionea sp. CnH1-48]MCO7223600.1 5'-nucleotidase [Pleionea sp. CnH1-48]